METENTELQNVVESDVAASENVVADIAIPEAEEVEQKAQSGRELTQDQAMRKSLKISYAIRTIAGFYLLYVSFQMFRTMDLNTGGTRLVSNLFMAFFAVIGLIMVVTSFIGNNKLRK